MQKQRARRGRGGGGEGAAAAIEQLLRLLEKDASPERDPLILRKAQVAMNWNTEGGNSVDWLCRQIPSQHHEAVRRACGYAQPAPAEAKNTQATPATPGPRRRHVRR